MMETNNPVARLISEQAEYLLYPNQTYRLGRSSESDIVVDDPKVSRNHAILEWNGSGFTLRDLDSSNGTFVNEQHISGTRLLRDGDTVLFGKQQFWKYEIVRTHPDQPAPLPKTESLIKKTITSFELPIAQPRGPKMVVSSGPDLGKVFPLFGETITIGRESRDATWEIRLSDRAISRPHARIERRDQNFYLVDLQSANGTQVNGDPVEAEVLLKEGDVVSLGETRLMFHGK